MAAPAPEPPRSRLRQQVEARAKRVVEDLLDVAESDPERLVSGLERLATGAERVRAFVNENPEGAKRVARNTLISLAARLVKRRDE